MIKKKLSNVAARELALGYLVGVPVEYLSQRYNRAINTIGQVKTYYNIRKDELGSKLKLIHCKAKRAILLYLGWKGVEVKIQETKAISRRDEAVYNMVSEFIFAPRTFNLIKLSRLEYIIEAREKQKKISPDEIFLKDLFSEVQQSTFMDKSLDFAKPIIYSGLENAFFDNRIINWDRLYEEILQDVYVKMSYGVPIYEVSEQHKQELVLSLNKVLEGLSVRGKEIINAYYEREGYNKLNLVQLSKKMKITSEGARVLKLMAFEKLRKRPFRDEVYKIFSTYFPQSNLPEQRIFVES